MRDASTSASSPAASTAEIAERLRAFLGSEAHGGPEIADMVAELGSLGEVAIFGGMPRDIARGGAGAFRSDVDLVVETSADKLAELMRDRPAVKNRFGGYRIVGSRHVFDVWALPSTWAVSSGRVAATNLRDLVRTTFFDCDAIVYLCRADMVHHRHGYVDKLHRSVVDIVLEDNPNPSGAVGRALRLLGELDFTAGPALRKYLCRAAASHLATGDVGDCQQRKVVHSRAFGTTHHTSCTLRPTASVAYFAHHVAPHADGVASPDRSTQVGAPAPACDQETFGSGGSRSRLSPATPSATVPRTRCANRPRSSGATGR